jgi:CelD/BcsL family acetyltransferase involved in cellulose biosynthesis
MTLLESVQVNPLEHYEILWDKLLSKSLDNNPFMTYEWLTTWSKYFARDNELKLFTVEDSSGCSLAAPVCYSNYKAFGSMRRKASFIGAPDSDYHVFLIRNLQIASRVVNNLLENIIDDSGADCLALTDVPEDSATSLILQTINSDNLAVSNNVINHCPYITLPNNCESFLRNLGSNMRRNLKVWERQALKDYRVKFISYSDIGSVKEAMKIFFKLHQKRQVSKGYCGVFADQINERFHVDIADAFAKKGWLALFFLTFNDEPVACVYGYEYRQKFYAYLCGFDPDYALFRPGYLVFKKTIEQSVRKNFSQFDFLRGDEDYKSRWKALVRNNLKYSISRHGLVRGFYNWNMENKPFSHILSLPRVAITKLTHFDQS